MRRFLAALALLLSTPALAATTVMVLAIGPDQVEVLINGSVLRRLAPRQATPEGVVLHEVRGEMAIIEVDGRRWQMTLGSATAARVVLQADPRGHFVTELYINGTPVRALVDTGATSVALNLQDAQRLRVDLSGAQPLLMHTAGGPRRGLRVRLASVQLGDIVLRNVEAAISESNELPIVLLGMSFLGQVDMHRSGQTLTLTRRH